MANTTQANVELIAPELKTAGIDPETWALVLADVANEVPSSVFGVQQERAQRYLAAHYLTLSTPSNLRNAHASGPVTAEKSGDVSRNYGLAEEGKQNAFDETSYGRVFNQIKKSCCIPFKVYTP